MGTKTTKAASTRAKAAGRKLEEFRAAHDKAFIIPTRIRDGLTQLGSDGWDYEAGFMKLCGVSTTDLAQYRDGFEPHIVNVGGRNPKRVWAGSPALARKLQEMV